MSRRMELGILAGRGDTGRLSHGPSATPNLPTKIIPTKIC